VVKKCPNCETDLPKDQETCPDCGKAETVKNKETETADPKNNVEQTNFPDTELNDPIEWSELKDLPVESVMELFHQSETAGDATANENDKLTEADIKFLKKKQKQSKNDDPKETEDDLEDDSILAAYIRAHREDTDREHAEELLKQIHEKVQTENTAGEESSVDTEISQDNEEPAAEMTEEAPTETEQSAETTEKPESSETIPVEEPEVPAEKEEPAQAEIEAEEPIAEELAEPIEENNKEQEPANVESVEEVAPEPISEPVAETSVVEEEAPTTEEEPSIPEEKVSESKTSKQELSKKEVLETKAAETESEQKTPLKQTEMKSAPRKSNRKKWYGLAAAIIILSAGGWAFYDNQQKVQAEKAAAIEQRQREMDQMENQLLAFYYDDAHEYIKTDMLGQDLTKLKQELDTFKDEKEYPDMEKTYQDIEEKIKTIQQTNELFTKPVIENDQMAENPLLKADQAVEISEESANAENGFEQLISKAQTEAKTQYEQLQEAKKQTAVVYKDDVLESANRDQYNKAKEAVDKIKNPDLAEDLKTQLKKVSDTLTAKEKAEKEKQEKAEKEKQEAEKKAQEAAAAQAAARAAAEAQAKEQAQKASQSSSASASQSNSANQPIMATRQSDIADSSNSAWNWAPGVKESVIATAIQRGYIVEGGYTLEKVRIENGEGYYNLFATSTDSALMKGIAKSALPFYIVTINCKTGWFGGNGSN
jgi:hypothetical protein